MGREGMEVKHTNMINLKIVIGILFIHWVADFICQTDWQAKNKSKDFTALLQHTLVYSMIWFIVAFICGLSHLFDPNITYKAEGFTFITLFCHTFQDYFTSRLNTKLWNEGKVHWFFVSVGFDQFLHYVQLLLTYYFLTR